MQYAIRFAVLMIAFMAAKISTGKYIPSRKLRENKLWTLSMTLPNMTGA